MTNIAKIADHYKEILKELDVWDDSNNGIKDTPMRVARYLNEFLNEWDGGNTDTTFESIQVDQLVVVDKIPAWSLCEHHLLPFSINVSVGYLAGSKVIGLSKIPRIIQKHCHKLQLQERIGHQIADELEEILSDSRGIAVYIEGSHTCMQARGIRSPGIMKTSVLRGVFREDQSLKDEFLLLVR